VEGRSASFRSGGPLRMDRWSMSLQRNIISFTPGRFSTAELTLQAGGTGRRIRSRRRARTHGIAVIYQSEKHSSSGGEGGKPPSILGLINLYAYTRRRRRRRVMRSLNQSIFGGTDLSVNTLVFCYIKCSRMTWKEAIPGRDNKRSFQASVKKLHRFRTVELVWSQNDVTKGSITIVKFWNPQRVPVDYKALV